MTTSNKIIIYDDIETGTTSFLAESEAPTKYKDESLEELLLLEIEEHKKLQKEENESIRSANANADEEEEEEEEELLDLSSTREKSDEPEDQELLLKTEQEKNGENQNAATEFPSNQTNIDHSNYFSPRAVLSKFYSLSFWNKGKTMGGTIAFLGIVALISAPLWEADAHSKPDEIARHEGNQVLAGTATSLFGLITIATSALCEKIQAKRQNRM